MDECRETIFACTPAVDEEEQRGKGRLVQQTNYLRPSNLNLEVKVDCCSAPQACDLTSKRHGMRHPEGAKLVEIDSEVAPEHSWTDYWF